MHWLARLYNRRMSKLTYKVLKAQHRRDRDEWPETTRLRIHRALSWLRRAEQCEDDDGAFVFLWVAFNAAYGSEIKINDSNKQTDLFTVLIDKLVNFDEDKQLECACIEFESAISKLLGSQYTHAEYWKSKRGKMTHQQWKDKFDDANRSANVASNKNDMKTKELLREVMERIYTLRNQIVHGGATWNSSSNRDTVLPCTTIMRKLMPLIIKIIMDNPNCNWGELAFAES